MTARHFVLTYDVAEGELSGIESFDDAEVAADAVVALEKRYRGDANVHVVMLSGESLESIKATHGTYFRNASDFMDSLAAVA